MIKRIILQLVIISLPVISEGQKKNMEYGFQGGLNVNTAYGNGVSKNYLSILTGAGFGTHIKMIRTSHFAWRCLLLYDENGWAYRSLTFASSTGTGLAKADVLFRMKYVNLPVLAEYSFGGKVKVHVAGGIFLGVLLNSKTIITYKQPLPPGQDAVTQSSPGNRSTINAGVSVGLGIQVPVASGIKLDIDMRNNTGLTNIYKSSPVNTGTIKTNTLAIQGGLSFTI